MMKLSSDQSAAMALALLNARASLIAIPPFTESDPELGVAEGYAIQQHLLALLLEQGETLAGYKLGLTSLPMQELLGVDQPDFGPIFSSTIYRDGATVSVSDFIAPRVEAEIAVVLKKDLTGPHCTPAQVYQATDGLLPHSG